VPRGRAAGSQHFVVGMCNDDNHFLHRTTIPLVS
jgi:hypothetical protein